MTRWYERGGGHWLSLALHILIFSWLATHLIRKDEQAEPPPLELSFSLVSAAMAAAEVPAPAKGPEQSPPEQPPPPDAAAATGGDEAPEFTVPETSDEDALAGQKEKESEPEKEKSKEAEKKAEKAEDKEEKTPETKDPLEEKVDKNGEKPAADKKPKTDPVKAAEKAAEESRKEFEKALAAFRGNRSIDDEQMKVRAGIEAQEVRLMGKAKLAPMMGAPTGSARTFELRAPQPIIDEVLRKNGMRIVTKVVSSQDATSSYLNRADVRGRVFEPSRASGLVQVFEISGQAENKLRILESEALKAKKVDTARTRVLAVTFGIVKTTSGYDLGVTNLQTEDIPFLDSK